MHDVKNPVRMLTWSSGAQEGRHSAQLDGVDLCSSRRLLLSLDQRSSRWTLVVLDRRYHVLGRVATDVQSFTL